MPAPTDEALQAVLHRIITRTMKQLTRRATLAEEQGSIYNKRRPRTLIQAAALVLGKAFHAQGRSSSCR